MELDYQAHEGARKVNDQTPTNQTNQVNEYNQKLFSEFAFKALEVMQLALFAITPTQMFLLNAAICSLGEPTITIFPKLSHSAEVIRRLGPTYREIYDTLKPAEQEKIQYWFKRFLDRLSYGAPSHLDLRD